jgi:adenine/guanine phosphoribosyltransferase-like PRPP-binding protein
MEVGKVPQPKAGLQVKVCLTIRHSGLMLAHALSLDLAVGEIPSSLIF